MDNTVGTATALLEKAKEDETARKYQDAIDKINQAATILVELGAWGEEELLTAQSEVQRLEGLMTTANSVPAEKPPEVPATPALTPEVATSTEAGKKIEDGTSLLEQAKKEENAGQFQAAIDKINAAAAILVEQGAWGEEELLTAQSEVQRLEGLLTKTNSTPAEKPPEAPATPALTPEVATSTEAGKKTEDGTSLLEQAKEEENAGQYQAAIDKINAAAAILVEQGAWGEEELLTAQSEVQRLEGLLTKANSTPAEKPPEAPATPALTPEVATSTEAGKKIEDGTSLLEQAKKEENAGQFQAAIDKINAAAAILVEQGAWGEEELLTAQSEVQRLEGLLTKANSTPAGKTPEAPATPALTPEVATSTEAGKKIEDGTSLLEQAKEEENAGQFQAAIDKINAAAAILVEQGAWGEEELLTAQSEVQRLEGLLTKANSTPAEKPPEAPATPALTPEVATSTEAGKKIEDGTSLLEQAKEEENAGQFQAAIDKINAAAAILVEQGAWGEEELLTAQSEVQRLEGLLTKANSTPAEKPPEAPATPALTPEVATSTEAGKKIEDGTSLLEQAKKEENAGQFQAAIDKINAAAAILVEQGAWGEEELLTAQSEVQRLEGLLTKANSTPAGKTPEAPATPALTPEVATSTEAGKKIEDGTSLLEQAKEEENAGQFQAAIDKINAAAAILVEQGAWGEEELLTAQSEVQRLEGLLTKANSTPAEKPPEAPATPALTPEVATSTEAGKKIEDGTSLLEQAKEEENAGQFQAAIDKINAAAAILVEQGAWGEEEVKAAQQETQRLEALLSSSKSVPAEKPTEPVATLAHAEKSPDSVAAPTSETPPVTETRKTIEDGTSLLEQSKENENTGQYQAAIEKINQAATILVETGAWGEDEIMSAQNEVSRLQQLLRTQMESTKPPTEAEKTKDKVVEEKHPAEVLSNHTVDFATNLLKEAKTNEKKAEYQAAIDKINEAATILVDLSAWGQDEIMNAQEEVARLQGLLDSKSAIDKLSAMDEDGLAPIPISPPTSKPPAPAASPMPPSPPITIKPPTSTAPPMPPSPPITIKPPASAAPPTPPSPPVTSQPPAPAAPPTPPNPPVTSQPPAPAASPMPPSPPVTIQPPEPVASLTPTSQTPVTPTGSKHASYDEGLPDIPVSPSQKIKLAAMKIPKMTKPIASPPEEPPIPKHPAPIKAEENKLVFTPPSEIPQDPDSAGLGDALSFQPLPEALKETSAPPGPNDVPAVPPRPKTAHHTSSVPKNPPPVPEAPNLIPIPSTPVPVESTNPTIELKTPTIQEKRDPLNVLMQKTKENIGFQEVSQGLVFGGKNTKPAEPLSNKPGILLFGAPKPINTDKSVAAQLQNKLHSSEPSGPIPSPAPEGNKLSGLARLKASKSGTNGVKVEICPMCGKMTDKCNCGFMKKTKK